MTLHNIGDTDYRLPIDVGGNFINAILDTASFDLVVFSAECTNCKGGSNLYDHRRSSTYQKGTVTKNTYYGSGSTHSQEAFERMSLCGNTTGDSWSCGLATRSQFFWEVLESELDFDVGEEWQMILGLGPPGGSIKVAEDNLAYAQDQLGESGGQEATLAQKDAIKEIKAVAAHARTATSFTENMRLQRFSICFGRAAGSPGRVVWNDAPPSESAANVRRVPVVSDIYWASDLRNVRLEGVSDILGCGDTCNGLIDSGTTLLAAPSSFVAELTQRLMAWRAGGGDCSDMRALPSLQFRLGDHFFTLPPASYMGKVVGLLDVTDQDLMSVLPHLQHIKDLPHLEKSGLKGSVDTHADERAWKDEWKAAMWSNFSAGCVPLLMTINEETDFGPMWILGAPFFREYYSTFALTQDPGAARPRPEAMYFTRADDDCHPVTAGKGSKASSSKWPSLPEYGLSLDISKIRLPAALRRAKAFMGTDSH